LGVKGILIKAAELGYITQVACRMPECFCPEELGGACHFDPVSDQTDWSPTHEHFPRSKREGGHRTVDNAVLAHRLCNRIDYSIAIGRSYASDLERVRKARDEAVGKALATLPPVSDWPGVTVWRGRYRISGDDPFFAQAVHVGRKYVDKKDRGESVSEVGFREEMVALRQAAPRAGSVLLDELEHRWSRPGAPPSLYVLTMEVSPLGDGVLVAGDKRLGRRAQSIKVGKAARSLAPRLSVYTGARPLLRGKITPGSLVLRAAVFGSGASMMSEREIHRHTRSTCTRLEVDDRGERLRVTAESYCDGKNLVEGILEFVRARIERAAEA
jgi:hypothetical protein